MKRKIMMAISYIIATTAYLMSPIPYYIVSGVTAAKCYVTTCAKPSSPVVAKHTTKKR